MKHNFMLPAYGNSQNTFRIKEKPMSDLRRFGLVISLTVILAGTAIAGETGGSHCTNPGESNGPPCSSSQIITDETSETSLTVSGEVEAIVVEATLYALESLITLY
jgi:heme A synthase